MKRLLSWRKFLRNNEVRFIWFSFEILDTIFGGIAGRPARQAHERLLPSRLPTTLLLLLKKQLSHVVQVASLVATRIIVHFLCIHTH